MLTKDEIDFLYSCSDNELMEQIVRKGTCIPEVLITLSDGCYQNSISSDPVTVIIEDLDSIEQGGGLFTTEASYSTPENFYKELKKAGRNVTIQHIANSGKPITEARIFVHDNEDAFPFNVMVSREIIATFKTFAEAAELLAEIGKAIKNDR